MMPEAYSEPYQKSSDGGDLCKNSYRQKAVNYFCKTLHLRCLTEF